MDRVRPVRRAAWAFVVTATVLLAGGVFAVPGLAAVPQDGDWDAPTYRWGSSIGAGFLGGFTVAAGGTRIERFGMGFSEPNGTISGCVRNVGVLSTNPDDPETLPVAPDGSFSYSEPGTLSFQGVFVTPTRVQGTFRIENCRGAGGTHAWWADLTSPDPERAAPQCLPRPGARHRLARARKRMKQERYVRFSFPPSPALGVYVHEIFIADNEFKLEGNLAGDLLRRFMELYERLPGARLAVRGRGDDREHSKSFDPWRVRAFVVLDFGRGSGYLIANHSTVRIQAKYKPTPIGPTLTKTLYNRSFSARRVTTRWKGGNNWVDAAWVTPETFRLRYGLRASGPGGSLILNTIDHQLLIDRRSGAVTFEGDRFPSTGTYRRARCGARARTSHRQFERKIANLGDDPRFRYDFRVSGVQPAG